MAARTHRPVIAVTGPRRGGKAAWMCAHWAIWLAGGRAVHLTPAVSDPPVPLDGIVIGGGDDIDPVLYAKPQDVNVRYDTERDAFESLMIEEALARNLPLLGICRGAQLLNVRLGGSLFQDLRERRRHTSNRRTLLPLKTLQIERDSALYQLLATTQTKVNSLHRQSIDRLGAELRVVGRDLDHIVQAVEAPARPFVMGVQWHPEYMPYSMRQHRIFGALIRVALGHRSG